MESNGNKNSLVNSNSNVFIAENYLKFMGIMNISDDDSKFQRNNSVRI